MRLSCLLLILTIFGFSNAIPNEEFIEALEENNLNYVQNFLNENPNLDLEDKTENGTVALHHAESPEMIQLLLNRGADINAQTDWDFSALHIAISFEDHEIRDLLLDRGIKVDLKDIDERTALYNAIAVDDLNSVKVLIENGASCTNLDVQSVSPLALAVSFGNFEMVEYVLNCSKELINHQNEFGFSALHTLALKPSNDTVDIFKLLISNGADKELRDENGNSAEDLADLKGHYAVSKMLRYYDLNNINDSYKALPILSELTTESASQIQGYVNYVLSLSNFSEITSAEVQKVAQDLDWEEDFGLTDQHLQRAQDNGISWNIEVYPSVKSLYSDLGNFRSSYLSGFEEIQPSLRSLEMGEVDQDWINEQIELEEMLWVAQGYSRSRITLLKRRLRSKLQSEAMDYSKGLKEVLTLLTYTKTQSDLYQSKSNQTLRTLENFRKDLNIDKENFKSDKDFLDNMTTIESERLNETAKEYKIIKEEFEMKEGEIDEIIHQMEEAFKHTQHVLEAHVVVAGLESAILLSYGSMYTRGKVLDNRAKSRQSKLNHFKRGIEPKEIKARAKAIQYKDNPLKGTKWINKINKAVQVNAKTGKDLGRLTKLQKSAASWSKNHYLKWSGRLHFASSFLAVASFGLGIYGLIHTVQFQNEREEQEKRLEKAQKELEVILGKLDDSRKMIDATYLTTASKVEAEFRLDTLTVKLDNAIEEANELRKLWFDIHEQMIQLEENAAVGLQASENEQADIFKNLMKSLRSIDETWNSIDDFALTISNTFYEEEIEADLKE